MENQQDLEIKRVMEQIGCNIRKRRRLLNWTQEELGEKADLDGRQIGFVERADVNATIKTLLRIAGALQCGIDDLLK